MEAVEINLPGGFPIGEQWHRRAWLRPVTGHVEEFLLQEAKLLPAARVTHLLTRCLHRLGSVEPAGPELARQLWVGDREALLLHLRRLTLGERISCVLSCPSCGEKLDLELTIEELLLPPYACVQRHHVVELSDGENTYRVVFRLPNGEDQEAAASEAVKSVDAAVELVLRRCIESVTSSEGKRVSDLPAVIFRRLPERMAALDPQADILLDLTCPECQACFLAPFDPGDYVCRELAADQSEFYREIHALSFHYHWTEEAILNLTRRKRKIYFGLLADALTRGAGNA